MLREQECLRPTITRLSQLTSDILISKLKSAESRTNSKNQITQSIKRFLKRIYRWFLLKAYKAIYNWYISYCWFFVLDLLPNFLWSLTDFFSFGLLNEYNRTCFNYENAYSFLIALTFYITKTQALNFLEFSFPGSFFFLKCVNFLESFLWQTLCVINPLLNFPFWYLSTTAAKNIKAWNFYPPLQQGRWHDMALNKGVKGSRSERLLPP